ncbi:MAG TPA: hypothetical protein VLF62_02365, partial [Candidatus Saccharimonadales bacterium]|nr:hypothetical protein [Candidatus Saccharimonadales bacterium]
MSLDSPDFLRTVAKLQAESQAAPVNTRTPRRAGSRSDQQILAERRRIAGIEHHKRARHITGTAQAIGRALLQKGTAPTVQLVSRKHWWDTMPTMDYTGWRVTRTYTPGTSHKDPGATEGHFISDTGDLYAYTLFGDAMSSSNGWHMLRKHVRVGTGSEIVVVDLGENGGEERPISLYDNETVQPVTEKSIVSTLSHYEQ